MVIKHALRTASLSLAVLVTLTGCTGTGGSATPPTSSSSGSPTTPAPTPTLVLEQVQRFDLGLRESWPLTLTPTEVLAPVSAPDGAAATQIRLLDLATGEQSVVAETQWPTGAIGGVAAVGDWVVWVDMRRAPTGSELGGVHWEVWAKNRVSGQTTMLDSNGTAAEPWPDVAAPSLVSGDGYVGWAKTGDDQLVHQLVWQPGWTEPRTLPLQLSGFDGASAIVDGALIFKRRSDDHWGQVQGLGNCWSYPLDGSGPAQQLTRSGLAEKCTMVGTDLVWTEHIDHQAERALRRKVGELPYQLMVLRSDGAGTPQIVHQGIMRPEDPVVGSGFAWWSSGGRPVISSLASDAELEVKNADPGPEPDGLGGRADAGVPAEAEERDHDHRGGDGGRAGLLGPGSRTARRAPRAGRRRGRAVRGRSPGAAPAAGRGSGARRPPRLAVRSAPAVSAVGTRGASPHRRASSRFRRRGPRRARSP